MVQYQMYDDFDDNDDDGSDDDDNESNDDDDDDDNDDDDGSCAVSELICKSSHSPTESSAIPTRWMPGEGSVLMGKRES